MSWLPNHAKVEYKDFSCVVMDMPARGFEDNWTKPLSENNVKKIVCTAEGTYDRKPFEEKGMEVVELVFADGTEPSEEVLIKWLELAKAARKEKSCLCVHCLAGLGRAPALVAVVLIEMGMDPTDAILYVRESRRGAISARQVKYLQEYRRRGTLRGNKKCELCTLM